MIFNKLFFITASIIIIFMVSVESNQECCKDSLKPFNGTKSKFFVLLKNESSYNHNKWIGECFDLKPMVENFSHLKNHSVALDFSINGTDFKGYIAWFDPEFVKKKLKKRAEVLDVQEDIANVTTKKGTITFKNPQPNLDRIDEARFPLDHKFTIPRTAGKGVNIYIVDSGININHRDFGGRARCGATFCDLLGCDDCFDRNGHGTHVAGIAGGRNFGVAKKSNIIAVKVCEGIECDEDIKLSNIFAGLEFVLKKHQKSANKKTVINLSLGAPKVIRVFNRLVKALTLSGIHVVVAAGNDALDVSKTSPGSTPEAITVGNIDNFNYLTVDRLSFDTNAGPLVDVFAPGVGIVSASHISHTGTNIFSGTSQAAPHVAGTVALIIACQGNLKPDAMSQKIIDLSTKDVIQGPLFNSSNRVLRVPSL